MTHDEASSLLPAYALGALEDTAAIEAHLSACSVCAADLAGYLDTTAALGAAVEHVVPPSSLRARVLAHAPAPLNHREDLPVPPRDETWVPIVSRPDSEPGAEAPVELPHPKPRLWTVWLRRLAAKQLATAAALFLIVGALAAGNLIQQQQLQASHAELALDQHGLDLLSSTETTNVRLSPIPPLGGDTHGHWFYRAGVLTQVLVVEAMPTPRNGVSYFGWLQRKDGTWIAAGRFALDSTGYGRIILPGSDGSDVRNVEVTSQTEETRTPTGTIVLRGP